MRDILPFIPSEAMILVIAVLGLGLIIGLIPRRTVGLGLGLVLLTLVVRPFLKTILWSLPLWLLVPLVLFAGFSILRRLASLLLGHGAADEMVGALAADFVRFALRLMFFPFVAVWRWAGRRY